VEVTQVRGRVKMGGGLGVLSLAKSIAECMDLWGMRWDWCVFYFSAFGKPWMRIEKVRVIF